MLENVHSARGTLPGVGLSFYPVGPRIELRLSGLTVSTVTLLSHLTDPTQENFEALAMSCLVAFTCPRASFSSL